MQSIYASEQDAPARSAVVPWDSLPAQLSWKEKIAYLGVLFEQLPPSACPVEHVLGAHGRYVRKMNIPAGTMFLGREHLHGHECSLLKGSVILITEEGKRQVDAVTTLHTRPGFHMVIYALTDIEAQTVHPNPTNSRDIDALEAEIFGPIDELRRLGLAVQERLQLK